MKKREIFFSYVSVLGFIIDMCMSFVFGHKRCNRKTCTFQL